MTRRVLRWNLVREIEIARSTFIRLLRVQNAPNVRAKISFRDRYSRIFYSILFDKYSPLESSRVVLWCRNSFFIGSLGVSLLARRIGLFVPLIREQLIIQEKSWNLIIFFFFFYNSLTDEMNFSWLWIINCTMILFVESFEFIMEF